MNIILIDAKRNPRILKQKPSLRSGILEMETMTLKFMKKMVTVCASFGFATANNKNNTMYTGNPDVTTRATTTRNIIATPAHIIFLTRSSPKSTTQRRSITMLRWMTLTTNPSSDTVPATDSESDTDYSSDEETIVASNCSRQSSATGGVSEGVLKSQSRVTHIPGLSSLAS